jgi:hypothetical protein
VGAQDEKHTRKIRCIDRSGQSGGKLTGFVTIAEPRRPKEKAKSQ